MCGFVSTPLYRSAGRVIVIMLILSYSYNIELDLEGVRYPSKRKHKTTAFSIIISFIRSSFTHKLMREFSHWIIHSFMHSQYTNVNTTGWNKLMKKIKHTNSKITTINNNLFSYAATRDTFSIFLYIGKHVKADSAFKWGEGVTRESLNQTGSTWLRSGSSLHQNKKTVNRLNNS